jgi:hypothetical protein
MSRAERRQYQRMMKGQDPRAPAPRATGRRPPPKRGPREPRDWSFSRGFWLKTVGVAALVGVIALSVTWTGGAERAVLVGAAAAVATVGLLAAFRRFAQRRAAAR